MFKPVRKRINEIDHSAAEALLQSNHRDILAMNGDNEEISKQQTKSAPCSNAGCFCCYQKIYRAELCQDYKYQPFGL